VRPVIELVVAIALLGAVLTAVSCGGPDLQVGGTIPLLTLTPVGTTTPGCLTAGDSCTVNADCCGGLCDYATDGQNLLCR
jgi:hypothetical protein